MYENHSLTSLAFDLLSRPTSSVPGAGLEVTVRSYVLGKRSDPVDTEIAGEFSILKGLGEITVIISAVTRHGWGGKHTRSHPWWTARGLPYGSDPDRQCEGVGRSTRRMV